MAECPENSDLGVCDVLSESGTGLGIFMEAIRSPLVKFLVVLAIIGAVVALVLGISVGIKKMIGKKL